MARKRSEATNKDSKPPRRKITSFEILLAVALLDVFGRLLYHIIYWRDFAQAIAQMTAVEWLLAGLFWWLCAVEQVDFQNVKLFGVISYLVCPKYLQNSSLTISDKPRATVFCNAPARSESNFSR